MKSYTTSQSNTAASVRALYISSCISSVPPLEIGRTFNELNEFNAAYHEQKVIKVNLFDIGIIHMHYTTFIINQWSLMKKKKQRIFSKMNQITDINIHVAESKRMIGCVIWWCRLFVRLSHRILVSFTSALWCESSGLLGWLAERFRFSAR